MVHAFKPTAPGEPECWSLGWSGEATWYHQREKEA